MTTEQREAFDRLEEIAMLAQELGEEAKQLMKANFLEQYTKGNAYDVFNLGSSWNTHDTTLHSLVEQIEEEIRYEMHG